MFGILAALNSILKPREGRNALNYENYIRTGQGLPSTKIYRESSLDRQARKDLATIRRKEQIKQQMKFVRLMKKLLFKIDNETSENEIDDEVEQMRLKVAELEIKVEKSALAKNMNCGDIHDMDKPDDDDDIELEEIIRKVIEDKRSNTENIVLESIVQDMNACGDYTQIVKKNSLLN
ncbi:hypothetical protein I4U23_018313 [Adineta vaga]|nr:hypothetical protein I4U23_018313 [Adineta vaga]